MSGYFQKNITKGSKVAIISANDQVGPFSIRLYVNQGDTATEMVRKAKTLKGAEKAAEKLLNAW